MFFIYSYKYRSFWLIFFLLLFIVLYILTNRIKIMKITKTSLDYYRQRKISCLCGLGDKYKISIHTVINSQSGFDPNYGNLEMSNALNVLRLAIKNISRGIKPKDYIYEVLGRNPRLHKYLKKLNK